jgi:hypothetical protein
MSNPSLDRCCCRRCDQTIPKGAACSLNKMDRVEAIEKIKNLFFDRVFKAHIAD